MRSKLLVAVVLAFGIALLPSCKTFSAAMQKVQSIVCPSSQGKKSVLQKVVGDLQTALTELEKIPLTGEYVFIPGLGNVAVKDIQNAEGTLQSAIDNINFLISLACPPVTSMEQAKQQADQAVAKPVVAQALGNAQFKGKLLKHYQVVR